MSLSIRRVNLRQRITGLLNTQISLKSFTPGVGKVKTRLAPAGWGFLGLILCGFIMAVNFSNNLIFAMVSLLISIALVGWYQTRMNLSSLVCSDWRTAPVFAGQKAFWKLTVKNGKAYGRHGLRIVSSATKNAAEEYLAPDSETEMILEIQTAERGLIRPASANVVSLFPLGIFKATLIAKDLPECLVYPKPTGSQPIPEHAKGGQAHLSSESGTYTDMRRYSPGDPLSRISWKAFARFDDLYTKEFDGAQGQPTLWLSWDDVRSEEAESRLSQLCRWILDAHARNSEYGLELPGMKISPSEGESHLRSCLKALALYGKAEAEV